MNIYNFEELTQLARHFDLDVSANWRHIDGFKVLRKTRFAEDGTAWLEGTPRVRPWRWFFYLNPQKNYSDPDSTTKGRIRPAHVLQPELTYRLRTRLAADTKQIREDQVNTRNQLKALVCKDEFIVASHADPTEWWTVSLQGKEVYTPGRLGSTAAAKISDLEKLAICASLYTEEGVLAQRLLHLTRRSYRVWTCIHRCDALIKAFVVRTAKKNCSPEQAVVIVRVADTDFYVSVEKQKDPYAVDVAQILFQVEANVSIPVFDEKHFHNTRSIP